MGVHHYTSEEIAFLRNNIKNYTRRELANLFNEMFDLQLSFTQICGALKRYKIYRENLHYHTSEELEFLRSNIKKYNRRELTYRFNRHFDLQLSFRQIIHILNHHKIYRETKEWFGLPLGTERCYSTKFVNVKIAKGKWRYKHHVVWEEANGPIPKDHVVIFADGNKFNFELDNLILISRRKLAIMCVKGLIGSNAELMKLGMAAADIYLKIGERKKQLKTK